MLKIKKRRFGECLHEFKTAYEAPLVKLHAEIRAKKLIATNKLRNRQAMKASALRRKEKALNALEKKEDDTLEFKLQEQLKDMLAEPDLTLAQFMTSGDPRVQEMAQHGNVFQYVKQRFPAFDAEAVMSDTWWPMGNLSAASPPARIKLDASERWLWEKALPEAELNKIISADILSCGLPLREDAKIVANEVEENNEADFEAQGFDLSYRPTTPGNLKPLSTKWMPVNVVNPAVLGKHEMATKKFVTVSRRIDFSSAVSPFVVESDDFPILTAMGKRGNTKIQTEFIQRKIKLRIHIAGLGLPPIVRQRLIELAGTRYSKEKRTVTLICDTQPTRDQNIAHVYKTAANLLNEAWMADLNYVPLGDPLMPHEQIQRELQLEAEHKEEQTSLDPTSFAKPRHITFFRVASFPQPESLQSTRQSVEQIIQRIATPPN
jgi:hypothetical protein